MPGGEALLAERVFLIVADAPEEGGAVVAGGEDAAEVFGAVTDLEETVLDGGTGAGGVEGAVGVGVDAGGERGVFAEGGVGAVGGEEEVVGAVGCALSILEIDAIVLFFVAEEALGGEDFCAGAGGGGVEDIEEFAATEAEGEGGGGEFGVGEVDELFVAVGIGGKAVDGFGVGDHLVKEVHRLEDGLAGGLEEDACADGAEGGGLFVEGDVVAGAGEEGGGGESCDACAGDADVKRVHGRIIGMAGSGARKA